MAAPQKGGSPRGGRIDRQQRQNSRLKRAVPATVGRRTVKAGKRTATAGRRKAKSDMRNATVGMRKVTAGRRKATAEAPSGSRWLA